MSSFLQKVYYQFQRQPYVATNPYDPSSHCFIQVSYTISQASLFNFISPICWIRGVRFYSYTISLCGQIIILYSLFDRSTHEPFLKYRCLILNTYLCFFYFLTPMSDSTLCILGFPSIIFSSYLLVIQDLPYAPKFIGAFSFSIPPALISCYHSD